VDDLHEHLVYPCVIRNAPQRPGLSIEMKETSIRQYIFHEPAVA
jgi:L-fuconate dehydratase